MFLHLLSSHTDLKGLWKTDLEQVNLLHSAEKHLKTLDSLQWSKFDNSETGYTKTHTQLDFCDYSRLPLGQFLSGHAW